MMENSPKLVTDFKPQIQEVESIKKDKYQKILLSIQTAENQRKGKS